MKVTWQYRRVPHWHSSRPWGYWADDEKEAEDSYVEKEGASDAVFEAIRVKDQNPQWHRCCCLGRATWMQTPICYPQARAEAADRNHQQNKEPQMHRVLS